MSLNQQYTWKNHLSECLKCNPKKGKRAKRASKEATSCFTKAFQTKVKDLLKSREKQA